MLFDPGRIAGMAAPALEIDLVSRQRIGDRHGLAVGGIGLAAGQRLSCVAGLVEGEDMRAVRFLKVVGHRKALGPVAAVTVGGLYHPRSVGPVPAIEKMNSSREGWSGIGLLSDG